MKPMKTSLNIVLAGLLFLGNIGLSQAEILPKGIIKTDPKPAPLFTLSDIDGKHYTFGKNLNRWTFVHFWASWCGPCRKEMPAIENLQQAMKNKPLEIVIINTAENEDTIFSFLGSIAPNINSLMDKDGLVTEEWQPRGLPATYLVDPTGIIRYQALGGRPWDSPAYRDWLRSLYK